jgi:hypothetical protein
VLAHAPAGSYDVIVLDVPAPFHVRTALLHTPSFYALVASRLRPGGVAAFSLCDSADGPVGQAIAASALRAFPSVTVVESDAVGVAVAYAGAPLPFGAEAVRDEMARLALGEGSIESDATLRARLAGVAPLSEDDLAAVLVLARGEFLEAFRAR